MAPPPLGAGHAGYGGGACGVSGARAATANGTDSRNGGGGDRGGAGGGGTADDHRGKKEKARLASASAAYAAADPHCRGFWDDSAVSEVYRVLHQRSQRQGVSACAVLFFATSGAVPTKEMDGSTTSQSRKKGGRGRRKQEKRPFMLTDTLPLSFFLPSFIIGRALPPAHAHLLRALRPPNDAAAAAAEAQAAAGAPRAAAAGTAASAAAAR